MGSGILICQFRLNLLLANLRGLQAFREAKSLIYMMQPQAKLTANGTNVPRAGS